MALIAIHVVAAFYHALVLRDGLLRRMFFGRRKISPTQSHQIPQVQS